MGVWILDRSLMGGVVLPLQLASKSGVTVAIIDWNLSSSASEGLLLFDVPARTAAACALTDRRCRYCWSAVPAFRGARNAAQQSGAVIAPVTVVVSGLLRLPLGPPLQRGFPALSLALVPFPYYEDNEADDGGNDSQNSTNDFWYQLLGIVLLVLDRDIRRRGNIGESSSNPGIVLHV